MTFQETLDFLYTQLPVFHLQGASAYKKDLSRTQALLAYLGNPHHAFNTIHIAGTNGKGSTSHLLASVLQEAGYKVGLYTSPHLRDFRERIKIISPEVSGEISEEFVCEFIEKHIDFFKSNELSFFEMSVGLAFEYFVKQKTDINIIEVGMGGRLDSTNIITPLISVITNIGLDHTQFLGNTLELIAFEKAGIIKPNIPVVIGEYISETKPVFLAKSDETHSEIYFASDLIAATYPSALLGDYQIQNKKTVLQTLKVLQDKKLLSVSETDIKNGFLNVIKNTGLQGRWQQLGENPTVICDTAHNAHGLKIVLNQLNKQKFEKLEKQKISYRQQADSAHIKNNQGQNQVWIINNSKDTVTIQMQDWSFICVLQAKTKGGQWYPIQYWRFSTCGNSYYSKHFPPKTANSFVTKLPNEGDYKTKIRYKLLGADKFFYSNEFDGRINYCEFVEDSTNYNNRGEPQPHFKLDSLIYLALQ